MTSNTIIEIVSTFTTYLNTGIAFMLATLVALVCAGIAEKIMHAQKTAQYKAPSEEEVCEEEVIACIGLESISAEEYMDMEDASVVVVETAYLTLVDEPVYSDEEYMAEEDAQVEEQEITLEQNMDMVVWTVSRKILSAVKFVKALVEAPARIAKLEQEIAELKQNNFDFDFDFYADVSEDEGVEQYRRQA